MSAAAENSIVNIVESPAYSKTLQTPDALYANAKVSLRIDESWLQQSTQQPQITEPRLLSKGAAAEGGKYGFSFAVAFGKPHDAERGARVSVQCTGNTGSDRKVKFDLIVGAQCHIENLNVPRDSSLYLLASVTPSVGRAATNGETILTFFFVIFLSSGMKGETNISLVMGDAITLLPQLTVDSKPKRPRGRPRTKQPESPDDGSQSSSAHEAQTTVSPKKKRGIADDEVAAESPEAAAATAAAAVSVEKRARLDEPRNVQRSFMFNSTARPPPPLSLPIEPKFSMVALSLEKKTPEKSTSGLLRRTDSVIMSAAVAASLPTRVIESQ